MREQLLFKIEEIFDIASVKIKGGVVRKLRLSDQWASNIFLQMYDIFFTFILLTFFIVRWGAQDTKIVQQRGLKVGDWISIQNCLVRII